MSLISKHCKAKPTSNNWRTNLIGLKLCVFRRDTLSCAKNSRGHAVSLSVRCASGNFSRTSCTIVKASSKALTSMAASATCSITVHTADSIFKCLQAIEIWTSRLDSSVRTRLFIPCHHLLSLFAPGGMERRLARQKSRNKVIALNPSTEKSGQTQADIQDSHSSLGRLLLCFRSRADPKLATLSDCLTFASLTYRDVKQRCW